MMTRVLGTVFLACLLAEGSALAQLAPTGAHYAGRSSDTGHSGVSGTGGFPAAVPLDFPAARGGIGIPISLAHGRRGFGAGGVGWDVPLSFVRRDTSIARHRPARLPGESLQARERMIVSVAGRTVEMTQSGDVWLARRDAPDWELREMPDSQGGTWHLRDGSGQELTFSTRPEIRDAKLWLLSSARSTTSSNHLALEYQVTQRPFAGGSGVEIDLISASYNTHPSAPSCAKNEIALDYNDVSSEPQSLSLLGDLPIVRMKKMWQIRVLARESCGADPVVLRRYLLDYADDPDTQMKRLSSVRVLGRDGTPEQNIALPVASYGYGTATSSGKLQYQLATEIPLPPAAGGTPALAGTSHDSGVSSPDGGNTYVGWQHLLDITGDGRPDFVFKQNDQLAVALNRPAANGASSLTETPVLPLSSPVFSGRPLSSHSSESLRYDNGFQNQNQVWRQTIDVNGDGRLDVIDAAEESGVWTIYLNTPGSPVTWVKRKFRVDKIRDVLEQHGHEIDGDHVPLSRRTTGFDLQMSECWEWDTDTDRYVQIAYDVAKCGPQFMDQHKVSAEQTFTEWEVRDINGDGYPDVVFNSSPVRNIEWDPCPPGSDPTSFGCNFHGSFWHVQPAEELRPIDPTNSIKAVINVVGVMFTDENPFSTPVTLAASICGVAKWTDSECVECQSAPPSDRQRQECSIEDVNGDGLADRVEGTSVRLGTGVSFGSATLELPNVPEQKNQHKSVCTGTNPGTHYEPIQVRGLRDLTGDGIPDFIEQDPTWRVWIGTGTGFRSWIAIEAPNVGFSISNTLEACGTDVASTLGGLYDIDGDGKPEVLQILHNPSPRIEVYRLRDAALGNPEAGRITSIDNGYGAITRITYRSAKEDAATQHQVPFPEIVVTAVETTGTNGLGGTLSAVRYAYGDAEQFYDPVLDAFTMRAYGRTIEVHGTGSESWDADYAIARLTYRLDGFMPGMTEAQRFERYQKVGRIRDTYLLGTGVERDPWEVLRTFSPDTDLRRRSGTHHEWDTRYVPLTQYTSSYDCILVDDPYNWNPNWLNDQSCAARGFTYARSSHAWQGLQPPGSSASNVETFTEVISVDDFGNVTELRNENDRHDPGDDVCASMTYARPTTSARILSALSKREITNCGSGAEMKKLSVESWEFDGLPADDVGLGRVTSRTTERRATDDGHYYKTIREYEIGYDSVGNPSYIASAREDGAVRTLAMTYDDFGLVPTSSTVDASGIDPFTTHSTVDPVSLSVRYSQDVHGTIWGREVDGFERTTRTTVQPADGSLGVASTIEYTGFSSTTTEGRSIRTTVFQDPVPPADASTADGHVTTTWLDELGRPRLTKRNLGRDYTDELIVLSRVYDGLGRVSFDADPYHTSQHGDTAYGTSYHYDTIGELACSIRGHGPQPLTFSTDLAAEVFPTCFTRTFSNHERQISVATPDSLDAGTPQAGTARSDTLTAIGRLKRRETWKQGMRLEASQYQYDRFGQLTSLRRFANPGAPTPTDIVEWTWRYDSRGQTIYSTEPEVAARSFDYSDWGEDTAVTWTDTAGMSFAIEKTYDALGRLAHSHERRAGQLIPETEYDWTYDTGESSPHLTPTFTAGRLAKTRSLIGDMHLSYDALGNITARAFLSKAGDWYVERHERHADGTPSALEFELPDNGYTPERYEYAYDSASRLRSVVFKEPARDVPLYTADTIDAWGRVRSATYGSDTTYHASYADTGRRLLLEETIAVPGGGHRSVAYRQYDAAGRELERYEDNPDKITTLSVYDAVGRLVRSLDGFQGQSFDRRFTYDALGNLTKSIDVVSSEETNLTFKTVDRDRICRIDYGPSTTGPCNVDHDGSGNIVTQPAPGEKPGDPPIQRNLEFFPSGAISHIDQGSANADFLYDGSGQIAYVGVSGPFLKDARNDRRFGLVEHRVVDIGGTPQSIIERHIPGPGGVIASRKGTDESFIFPFADSRGTRTTTDGSSFVQDITYQPFGKATSSELDPRAREHTHYQWNSGDALADLGVVHLGARMYDPNIGRFLSRDPLVVQRSAAMMNPYGFALNDPVNFSDPTGLDCAAEELGDCDSAPPLIPILPGFGASNDSAHQAIQDIYKSPSLLEYDARMIRAFADDPHIAITNPIEMFGVSWRESLRTSAAFNPLKSLWDNLWHPIPLNPLGNYIMRDSAHVAKATANGDLWPLAEATLGVAMAVPGKLFSIIPNAARWIRLSRLGSTGAESHSSGKAFFRIITEEQPVENFVSNAARGRPPRGPEIGDEVIFNGVSTYDSLARAEAKVPVLERGGATVRGIAELRIPTNSQVTATRTIKSSRGHFTLSGTPQSMLELWFHTHILR